MWVPPVIEIEASPSQPLLPFLWLSILAGFSALLTPCVFPMIPITVSYFIKKKDESPKNK